MEGVEYIFLDPGIGNIGLVFLKFTPKTHELRKVTLNASNKGNLDLAEILSTLEKNVFSTAETVYLLAEKNFFKENPNLTNELSAVQPAIEMSILCRFPSTTIVSKNISSLNVKPAFGISNSDRNAKTLLRQAFCELFALDIVKVTFHESDSFAAGMAILTRDSLSKDYSKTYPIDIRNFHLLYLEYVRKALQLYHSKNDTSKPAPLSGVLPRGLKKSKAKMLESRRTQHLNCISTHPESTEYCPSF